MHSDRPDAEKSTVFVIPHTHWDREWYAPFQLFRIRLVRLMDDLLDLLERDATYTHFNLDGQTVVLHDYLEIRPEKRPLLQKLVQAGRIGVGPWYVLPDEFLVSGEALTRNLLLGHRIAAEFGRVQKVGYIPDTFGHISQLPQILRGFDIPYAMHFRGLEEGNLKSELWWQSPDGSRVLLRHLPTDLGYVNASALAVEISAAAADLHAIARYERRRASTSVLLAMNGVDHAAAREDLPEILRQANALHPESCQFRQASLGEYFAALSAAIDAEHLQTVYGELRDTNRTPGRGMRVLPHILSSRIYNKQQNERAQSLLERWAEPWSAILWTQGRPYPAAFLWKAWEWLLQNHAHDSIGGCSVDAVHAQMETRFAWTAEIGHEITAENFQRLAEEVDLSDLQPDEAALILFNALPWDFEGVVNAEIDLWDFFLNHIAMLRWETALPESAIHADMEAPEIFRWRTHYQWAGNPPIMPSPDFRGLRLRPLGAADPLPIQIESIERASILRPGVSGPPSFRDVKRVRASFRASVPALGYQVYAIRPEANPNHPITLSLPHNVLENAHLRVQIQPNGALTVTDKASDQTYRDLAYFEDGGDCGDGYNYSYPLEDRLETTLGLAPRIARLTEGPAVQRYRIEYDWQLPEGLDDLRRKRRDARVHCPLSVTVSLAEGSPRLDLQIDFDNRARDHRLRVVFPSDIQAQTACADAQFDVVERPIQILPVPEGGWVEDAPRTFPQQDWVDISDGARGLCLINQGLPEYEVLDTPRREIAITLLRAVAYLGAGAEMRSAVIGAGPNIPTPGGQVQRQLTYHLSIFPHSGRWDEAEVWRQAREHNLPPRCTTFGMIKGCPTAPGSRAARDSFLSVTGRNVILSALKKAEEREALILRLYNPSSRPTLAEIRPPFAPTRVQRVNLSEQPLPDSPIQAAADGALRLEIPAGKIITLSLER